MDFTFTEDQMMVRETAARLLSQHYGFDQRQQIVHSAAGRSDEIWQQFREMGLLALPFPESLGGFGGKASDVLVMAELLGEFLVVEPYLSSILFAGRALAMVKGNATAADWLGRIMEGDVRGALSHEEKHGTADCRNIATTVAIHDGKSVLSGEKAMVLDGAEADVLVVTARAQSGGLQLLLVEPTTPGITIQSYTTIDGRRAANIRFDGVPLSDDAVVLSDAEGTIQAIVNGAILALCAEAVGCMGALLQASADYAGTRKQFGVAIGSFQALAHRLADMKLAYVKARSTLLYTAAIIESDRARTRDYSLLKAQVGRLGRAIAESAIQIHGGVGTTDEVTVGHHLKRIMAIDAMFGPCDYHLRLVGAEA